MPGLTAPTLPDDLEDPLLNLTDDEIEVNHVKGDLPEDAPILEPKGAQNEDGADSDDGDSEDEDNPAIQAAVARERARTRQREDVWLKEQEAADNALLNSERQKLAAQKESFKMARDALDVRIKTAHEALKLARQDSDYNAATDIEHQIGELRALKAQVEGNESKLPQESQLDDAFKKHIEARRERIKGEREQDDAGSPQGVKPLNTKAEKWAAANKSWFGKNKDAMDTLAKIDSAMAAEGYDPKKDDYFVELTKRMTRSSPKLGVKDFAGRGAATTRPAANQRTTDRAPVAGARSAAPAIGGIDQSKKIRVSLDATDRAMMKKLGLDPANEKHTARFAKERGIRLAQEARG